MQRSSTGDFVYNIAVDARPLSFPISGVSRVISRVIKYFPNTRNFRFFLYSHLPCHSDFSEIIIMPNVFWIKGRGLMARRGGIWFNISLPLLIRNSYTSLFWGSQQVIPFGLPRNLPVVLTFYDLVLYFFPKAMRIPARIQQKLVQKYSVAHADRILTISNQTREDMIKRFNYSREKTKVALLGYESPRKKTGVGQISNKPFILAVSTIEPRKNYITLIEAYARYLEWEKKEPYCLVIAGRHGWESNLFYRRLEELKSRTGSIFLIDDADDETIAELYRNCAFFCFTTLYEGFGLPLLEALAMGKHALVSDLKCLHEIGGKRIRYLPGLDSEIWTRQINEMVDLHRRGKLKKFKFPVKDWSWQRTAALHYEAFNELLDF